MPAEPIVQHYARSGSGQAIAARVLAAVPAGDEVTPEALAPVDHFHSRGLTATQELAARLAPQAGDAILDIGGGIGGPARWIAATFRCSVASLDLVPEYCDAARLLNAACGLADRVSVLNASALAIPLADNSVDRAYSHNALMNVADKACVYREAFRVLKPGGRLVLSQYNAGPDGPPAFPVPWASAPAHSFLTTDAETRHDLVQAGFVVTAFVDATPAAASIAAARKKLEERGLPRLGVHVFMGADFHQAQVNGMRAQEEGRVRAVDIVAQKPA